VWKNNVNKVIINLWYGYQLTELLTSLLMVISKGGRLTNEEMERKVEIPLGSEWAIRLSPYC
jgi:hypothetical protein